MSVPTMQQLQSTMSAFVQGVQNEDSVWDAYHRYDWSQLDPRHASTFKWERGVTPLSDFKIVVLTWLVYWTVVYLLGPIMASTQAPFKLTWVAAAHNTVLMVWSAVMLVALADAVIDQYNTFGLRALFCAADDNQVSPRMHYWLYIFYVSKFYELLDTVLLRLKKRPLIFLHWFHHTVVIAMTWSWVHFKMNFACCGMLANTLVHVFMYYYYLCAALKIKVWFKKYITSMQLVQFATSFALSVIYIQYASDGTPCYGSEFGPFEFTLACNISFFVLFAVFYVQNYSTKAQSTEVSKPKNE
eukprot:m.86612 g.86612  ORF g.86612 m.86612 type:complete len:300 (-) comp9671_c1_seq1:24-923(-)